VLLSFLKIRVVVNGQLIYPLLSTKPVVIPVPQNNPRVVITDGFHHTIPLKLVYKDVTMYCFKVSCAIDDKQFYGGLLVMAVFYLAGFFTAILFFKIISFLPVIYLLAAFYLNRKEFLQLKPVIN